MPHIPDSRHADHDALAIAAYAAGDATGIELETASDLVAACADCAALHADLRAIASALPALPAPARTRDFILTPEQAASLRPAGWRRLLAPLAGPRFAFAGPLGGGLATLGLAGLLVAGSLGVPIAGSAPAGGGDTVQAPVENAGPEASAPIERTGLAGEPVPSPGAFVQKATDASPAASVEPNPEILDAGSSADPFPILVLGSAALLAVGLVLGGLRLAGRRLAARG